jgi:hypothetical protein
MEWSDLSNRIRGQAPVVRYGHDLEVVDNFLCLFGGIGNTSELATFYG